MTEFVGYLLVAMLWGVFASVVVKTLIEEARGD